jgi:hypothetical protein
MSQSDKSLQRDWPIRGYCGEGEIWTGGTRLGGLGLLSSGEKSVGDRALQLTAWLDLWWAEIGEGGRANLECAADAEDTVVGLLGGKALDGLLHGLALLGDEVVEPGKGLATGLWTSVSAGDIQGPGRMRHGSIDNCQGDNVG